MCTNKSPYVRSRLLLLSFLVSCLFRFAFDSFKRTFIFTSLELLYTLAPLSSFLPPPSLLFAPSLSMAGQQLQSIPLYPVTLPPGAILRQPEYIKRDQLTALMDGLEDSWKEIGPEVYPFFCDGAYLHQNAGLGVVWYQGGIWRCYSHRIAPLLYDGRMRPNDFVEMYAIYLAVYSAKYHFDTHGQHQPEAILRVYTDSQRAMRMVEDGYAGLQRFTAQEVPVVEGTIATIDHLRRLLGVRTQLIWVPSHAGVPGQEKADYVAVRARMDLAVDDTVLQQP